MAFGQPGNDPVEAAHLSWAFTINRAKRTEPGRLAAQKALENKVDPDRKMSEADRRKAAKNYRKAQLRVLSAKGVAARDQRLLQRKQDAAVARAAKRAAKKSR